MHIDVIPVEIIKDISELTENHIPLLQGIPFNFVILMTDLTN
jgi:hypothetical protein